ncbi:peptide ABC transporter substrate-binding protein [Caproiciproducens sp. NJN-50]|uniref:peptide ABC transporter substrate-binding protein n=1 Tax=Acutalibacteraceae TaxID=3082771 RepID=UPI000FFE1EDD|nr:MULTISPECIES: peptide ABC transporter substrate-binding protein [Acutalibacteraceae]QAT49366.1 peptide ABC transporter substrate-binding protein [Caproiciproducens sp. NJN-50]
MTKKLLSSVLAAAMIATAFTGCGGSASTSSQASSGAGSAAQSNTSLSVHVGSEPDSMDPALNTAVDGGIYIQHVFEGLTKLDESGKIVNGQAKDIKASDDGLTYTATLRDDIKWSDGKAVTAQDFVYAWQRLVDPKTASEYSYMMDPVVNATDIYTSKNKDVTSLGVTAKDDKTLVIKLNAPCAYFLQLLSRPMFYPLRKDVVDGNDKWTQDPKTYIGNGPYKMTAWNHKESIIDQKSDTYYNKDAVTVNQIKFMLMDDDSAIQAAYQNGELQFADSYPVEEQDKWAATKDYHSIDQLATYYVAFNCKKAPFDNPKVRKALTLVVDRNYIIKNITKAGQIPADAFVSTGVSDADTTKQFRDVGGSYYSVKDDDYDKNVAEAKQLLSEAGYPDGKGFPTFEYSFNTNSGHKAIAEALQNMWKEELGINCTLASQEFAVFIDNRQKGNYDVARDGWIADYNDPISYLDLFMTNSGNNDPHWSNKDYDALIAKAKATGDQTVRMQSMHDAEKILMDDMPACPIYFYTDPYLLNTNISNVVVTPLGDKIFAYAKVAAKS